MKVTTPIPAEAACRSSLLRVAGIVCMHFLPGGCALERADKRTRRTPNTLQQQQ